MNDKAIYPKGLKELKEVRDRSKALFISVFIFSIFVNLLMLTGPIYMLQVYDRVLSSRSVETLLALTILVVLLYLLMGVLDWARGRVLARVGARFHESLSQRVFYAVLKAAKTSKFANRPITALTSLTQVQTLLSSPALFAICDIPWTPIFIAVIFMFHPYLGWFALAGGIFLVGLSILNQCVNRATSKDLQNKRATADRLANTIIKDHETVEGLGMRHDALRRWKKENGEAMHFNIEASDSTGFITSLTKSFRLMIQSCILGLGAWLAIRGELSPGAMIAGSILLGRALAPVELAIAQWPLIQQGKSAWTDLSEVLEIIEQQEKTVSLPTPKAELIAKNLIAGAPGSNKPILRGINFKVNPGTALGVIGQSASGKSSLARVLTGFWPIGGGEVRLGGATLDQYDPDELGKLIGYVPQRMVFFDATISENIARMETNPNEKKVIDAAKKAGAHELILEQPNGYNTQMDMSDGRLSGGQLQRIGLARALYGNPAVLVLDEPNSALDAVGSAALNSAIRTQKSEGKSVVIMAHRPSAIQECETLLILENGISKAYGPTNVILNEHVKNAEQIKSDLQKSTKRTPKTGGAKRTFKQKTKPIGKKTNGK